MALCRDSHALYQVDQTTDSWLKTPAFQKMVEGLWRKHGVRLRVYRYPLSPGCSDIVVKINHLALQTYRDACDYIMFGLSDLSFDKPGWDTKYVRALQSNGGFGWAGEEGWTRIPGTKAKTWSHVSYSNAVAKGHMELFEGNFIPPKFKNWFLDDWLRQVYKSVPSTLVPIDDAEIYHDHGAVKKGFAGRGSRYEICRHHRNVYNTVLARSRKIIIEAAKAKASKGEPSVALWRLTPR